MYTLTGIIIKANLHNELFKHGQAISYSKLGNIHQAMGHMDQTLEYFEKAYELTKEISEANPRSEELKNGLGISYENLGAINHSLGSLGRGTKIL